METDMAEQFEAHVQYDDWIGTAAADNADRNDMWDLLRSRGLIGEDEFLIGIEFSFLEHSKAQEIRPWVRAYIVGQRDFESVDRMLKSTPDPIPARTVRLDLSLQEFCDLFKRFAVSIGRRGLDFAGREVETDE